MSQFNDYDNSNLPGQPLLFKSQNEVLNEDYMDFNDFFQNDFYPQEIDYFDAIKKANMIPAPATQVIPQETLNGLSNFSEMGASYENPSLTGSNTASGSRTTATNPSYPTSGSGVNTNFDDSLNYMDQMQDYQYEFNEGALPADRKERNREHAKRSRIRKKVLLDSLQDQLTRLRKENNQLRRILQDNLPSEVAREILDECTTQESNLLLDDEDIERNRNSQLAFKPSELTSKIAPTIGTHSDLGKTNKLLVESDFRLMQSLVKSQQTFILTDPSLPDNPIVYASEGFCKMTGYKRHEILGRNCRFLQGTGTDLKSVELIRKGLEAGRDVSVCILNYKANGKPFWNHLFLAALKNDDGEVVNFVGVQCEVNSIPIKEIKDRVKKLPIV